MSGSWPPDPEPGGALEPPRRRPPTAVGLATPPPPPRDRSQFPSYYRRHLLRKRIAGAVVGSTMAITAVGLASIGGIWMALASGVLGISGSALIIRSIRGGRPPLLSPAYEFHVVPPAWAARLKRRRAA